jgi:hypothetical protein
VDEESEEIRRHSADSSQHSAGDLVVFFFFAIHQKTTQRHGGEESPKIARAFSAMAIGGHGWMLTAYCLLLSGAPSRNIHNFAKRL